MVTVDKHIYIVLVGSEERCLESDRDMAQGPLSALYCAALYVIICPHPENILKLVLFASFCKQGNWERKRWRTFPRSYSEWVVESGSDPRLVVNFGKGLKGVWFLNSSFHFCWPLGAACLLCFCFSLHFPNLTLLPVLPRGRLMLVLQKSRFYKFLLNSKFSDSHIDSLRLVMVGMFTPWKPANAATQSVIFWEWGWWETPTFLEHHCFTSSELDPECLCLVTPVPFWLGILEMSFIQLNSCM